MICLCSEVVATHVCAQEMEDRGDFFAKNFANQDTANQNETESNNENLPTAEEELSNESSEYDSSEPEETLESDNKQLDAGIFSDELQDSSKEKIEISTPKITKVSLWVSGTDSNHLKEVSKQIERISKKLTVPITVTVLGGELPTFPDLKKVSVLPGASIPSEYSASRSPLWVLQTPKGPAVLEGIVSVSQFIDGRGHFTEAQPGSGYEIVSHNGGEE